jgi:hypothetical protein
MYPHPSSNTTALLKAQFQKQMEALPDDGKPVFLEEFFPLSLAGVSFEDYLAVFIEVTQPRARAYTTYYCANNPSVKNPIADQICEAWLQLVQKYATNTTANLALKSDDGAATGLGDTHDGHMAPMDKPALWCQG